MLPSSSFTQVDDRVRWHVQFRSMLAGAVISTVFSIIVHKLNLPTGIVPSLNIAAGLLGFVFLRGWVYLLRLMGIKAHEFTPQASTLIPLPSELSDSCPDSDGVIQSVEHAMSACKELCTTCKSGEGICVYAWLGP